MKSGKYFFSLSLLAFSSLALCDEHQVISNKVIDAVLAQSSIGKVFNVVQVPQGKDELGREGVTLEVISNLQKTSFRGCFADTHFIDLRFSDATWKIEGADKSRFLSLRSCRSSSEDDFLQFDGSENLDGLADAFKNIRHLVAGTKTSIKPNFQSKDIYQIFHSSTRPEIYSISVNEKRSVIFNLTQDDFFPESIVVEMKLLNQRVTEIDVRAGIEFEVMPSKRM